MSRLEGSVAIITGGARGTGATTVRTFVREGAKVLITDVLEAEGEQLAAELGSSVRFMRADVTSETDWDEAVATAEREFGPLRILVNNAGILHMAAFEETTGEDFERVFRVNQLGPFLGIKAVTATMKAQGSGSIVNVTSIDSMKAKNGIAAYAASKWGTRGMAKVAALELGRYGIRVNCVCPEAGSPTMIAPLVPDGIDVGKVIGTFHHRLDTQKRRDALDRVQDVANAILYFASDESASCTGTDLVLDSGITAGTIVAGAPGAG